MQSSKLLLMLSLALAVQACSNDTGASVQEIATIPSEPGKVNTMADTAFARKAAMGGLAEVALGELAAKKATDPKVKSFGLMMITDHGKANDELKSIAQVQNLNLPTELDAKHKALHDSLDSFSGREFDMAYVKTMLDDHIKDLDLMEKEAQNGMNADLREFAAKTAPVIQKHLTDIREIVAGMK